MNKIKFQQSLPIAQMIPGFHTFTSNVTFEHMRSICALDWGALALGLAHSDDMISEHSIQQCTPLKFRMNIKYA